jgi:hypothetical protein
VVAHDTIELLVTVKAYPAISTKYGEVVCVAGIRTDTPEPVWVRLFPVAFRDMPFDQRFKKYDVIRLRAEQHTGDARPESWRPDVDSVEVVGHLDPKNDWSKRRPYVEPLVADSMCDVLRRQREDGTSLAAFRPGEVLDFTYQRDDAERDERKQAIADQPSLFFMSKKGLEKIPYVFRYRYRCAVPDCRGHHQSIIDWELAESFRSWTQYPEAERLQQLRRRWLQEMCSSSRDPILFVGNQHMRPEVFMVLGVFWPPAPTT